MFTESATAFRQRLLAGEFLLGTFIKTPAAVVCEVLAQSGLDMLCIDAEHAPFDRHDIDVCTLAAHAGGTPALVRVAANRAEAILQALDVGAAGIVVPHVASVTDARNAVRQAHFGPGGRGFAGSTRAAGFAGRPLHEHLEQSARATTVIAQIEDAEALQVIDEIVQVDGIDCVFVGRSDLTVALGAMAPDDPRVIAAVEQICGAARRAGRRVGMFLADFAEVPHWIAHGATLFLLESDQVFLLAGARALRERLNQASNPR